MMKTTARCLLAMSVVTGCGPALEEGPRLRVERENITLGTFNTEKSHTVSFRIENIGDEPLRIGSVDSGCGCAVPSFPRSLPPGGKGVIDIAYRPEILWHGIRNEEVIVRTNDRRKPDHRLSFTISLNPPFKIEPGTVVNLPFSLRQGGFAALAVTPRDPSRKVISVQSTTPGVSARLDGHKVKVKVSPRRTAGDFDANILLKTSDPALAGIPIRIQAKAQDGPISVPHSIHKRSLAGNLKSFQVARLAIQSRSGPLSVVSVQSTDKALAIRIEKRSEKLTVLTVEYTGGWNQGPKRGSIRIRTSDRDFPILEVPFHFERIL